MANNHHTPTSPIEQVKITPISEMCGLFCKIQKNLFKLERLDPDGPEWILECTQMSIRSAMRKIDRENKKNIAQIIQFEMEV